MTTSSDRGPLVNRFVFYQMTKMVQTHFRPESKGGQNNFTWRLLLNHLIKQISLSVSSDKN